MSKTTVLLLAAALTSLPAASFAQSQSPDQQQPNSTNKPSQKATQPQNENAQAQTGQSPDIQQEKNGSTGSKQHKKNRNNAHQAHGTPKPKNDTAKTNSAADH